MIKSTSSKPTAAKPKPMAVAATPPATTSGKKKLSGGNIALIVIFSLAFVALLVTMIVLLTKKDGTKSSLPMIKPVHGTPVLGSGGTQTIIHGTPVLGPGGTAPVIPAKSGMAAPVASEQAALTAAFQYGMKTPPCGFNVPVDGAPGSAASGKPLTALAMSPGDYAMARAAQSQMIASTGPDCLNPALRTDVHDPRTGMSTLQTMNAAAAGAAPQAGMSLGQAALAKTDAALAAVGGHRYGGPAPVLGSANDTYTNTMRHGMLADGNDVFGNTSVQTAETPMGAALGGDVSATAAMPAEDAKKFNAAFNLDNKMGDMSKLSGPDLAKHRAHNKALHQMAKANPDMAGALLLNAGSTLQPSQATMQSAWLNAGKMRYSQISRPATRTLNMPISAAQRPSLAVPVPSNVTGNTFNVSSPYFDQFRANACSGQK